MVPTTALFRAKSATSEAFSIEKVAESMPSKRTNEARNIENLLEIHTNYLRTLFHYILR